MPPLFPMHVVSSQEELDSISDKYCHIMGSNGIFLKKENIAFAVIQPLYSDEKMENGIPGLLKIETKAVLRLPKIPNKKVKEMLNFFSWCWEEFKSEGSVYIYYKPSSRKGVEGEYAIIPPTQEVGASSVDYGRMPDPPEGFYVVGTAHSHGASMNSFHSKTDDDDQSDMDGIHITFGDIVSHTPSIDAKLYVNGKSYDIKTEQLFPDFQKPKLVFPEDWKKLVSKKVYKTVTSQSDWPATNKGGYGYDNKFSSQSIFNEFLENIAKYPDIHRNGYDHNFGMTVSYNPDEKKIIRADSWKLSEFERKQGKKDTTYYWIDKKAWNKKTKAEKSEWLFKIGRKFEVLKKQKNISNIDPFNPEQSILSIYGMGYGDSID